MPCDDCSTDDLCRCGPGEVCGHCFEAARAVGRVVVLEEPKPATKGGILRCTCGHHRIAHEEGKHRCGAGRNGTCGCQVFMCDHSACGWKPRENNGTRWWKWSDGFWRDHSEPELPEEPPMTPEEEEEAPEDGGGCSEHPNAPVIGGMCGGCTQYPEDMVAKPPQPDGRPPYLLAYSVQGHLYEVALPGDATVRAVDGALVITHHLAPVAGIVQIRPLTEEQT